MITAYSECMAGAVRLEFSLHISVHLQMRVRVCVLREAIESSG